MIVVVAVVAVGIVTVAFGTEVVIGIGIEISEAVVVDFAVEKRKASFGSVRADCFERRIAVPAFANFDLLVVTFHTASSVEPASHHTCSAAHIRLLHSARGIPGIPESAAVAEADSDHTHKPDFVVGYGFGSDSVAFRIATEIDFVLRTRRRSDSIPCSVLVSRCTEADCIDGIEVVVGLVRGGWLGLDWGIDACAGGESRRTW